MRAPSQIDNFISMSYMKYDAIVKSGIEIVNRIELPIELVPRDAEVGARGWLLMDFLASCYFITAIELVFFSRTGYLR